MKGFGLFRFPRMRLRHGYTLSRSLHTYLVPRVIRILPDGDCEWNTNLWANSTQTERGVSAETTILSIDEIEGLPQPDLASAFEHDLPSVWLILSLRQKQPFENSAGATTSKESSRQHLCVVEYEAIARPEEVSGKWLNRLWCCREVRAYSCIYISLAAPSDVDFFFALLLVFLLFLMHQGRTGPTRGRIRSARAIEGAMITMTTSNSARVNLCL
jgi:hypothetical protein